MSNTTDTLTLTTIEDALKRAAARLRERSDSARLDAEILLVKVLGVTRAGLTARSAQPLQQRDETAFNALLTQRLCGTPVAYLTGNREFWSLPLRVSPAVLVPRPETEILVEQLLELAPAAPARSVLDLGTGSGAIALAIASERPDWKVTGSDVSPDALDVAESNSRDLGITNVEWLTASWFDAVPGRRFDFIVSNPPYVAAGDPLLAALAAEPMLALSPGATGLESLQLIVAQAHAHLLDGGCLLLEHGHDQAPAVQALLRHHGFESIRTCLDLSGITRITLATFKHT
jgi:release factor glutamine methyltransferase